MNNIRIYHQCGFRYKWNTEIKNTDNVGDGFIISPLDMNMDILKNLDDKELETSF